MGLIKTWDKFQEDLGSGVASFAQETVKVVTERVCQLHRKYPNNWLVAPFTRGYLNQVCEIVSVPPPRVNDNQGYVCPGIYGIEGIATYYGQNLPFIKCEERMRVVAAKNFDGVIHYWETLEDPDTLTLGYLVTWTPRNGNQITEGVGVIGYTIGDNRPMGRVEYRDRCFQPNFKTGGSRISEGQIVVYEEPDPSCENEGEYYEPTNEWLPTDFNDVININNYNSNGDVIEENYYDFSIDNSGQLKFPITVNLGGKKIKVDFDGVSTSDDDGNGGNGGDSGGDGGGTTTKYKDPFDPDRFTRYYPDSKQDEEQNGEQEIEEEEVLDEEIVWVLVTITQLPSKGKTILQETADNNTYFAGYFSWIIEFNGGKYRLEEIPIRKRQMAFKSPIDSLGYVVYTVNNAKLITQTYKQKIESEVT